MSNINLDAYFQRLQFHGPTDVSLATLQALIAAHTQHIPFENLDSFTGKVTQLDLPALEHKLLLQQRGGFCFEHNTLMWRVLQQLGFKVCGLAARVRWQVPDEIITPIGHMVLKVSVAGAEWLVDTGFGAQTPTTALRMFDAALQATTHEPFQLVQRDQDQLLRAQLGDVWQNMYSFDQTEYFAPDYVVWNWFTCTSPESPFTRQLRLACVTPEGRHTLRGNQYTHYPLAGGSHSTTLTSVAELRRCITDNFQINLDGITGLDARLAAQLAAAP